MTTALVTGGAGFIGSHLVRSLVREGTAVRVYDDLSSGSKRNLQGLELEFIEADVLDQRSLMAAATGVDVIYHLAALVSVAASVAEPVRCYQTNLLGSLNVLQTARQSGVKRVVLASSAAVYGERDLSVGEDLPPQPHSPYAASKWAMEQAASAYALIYSVETACPRYFNVYGPGQTLDSDYAAVIPTFISALLGNQPLTVHGDGRQRRDFVFVEDAARATLLAGSSDVTGGQAINVASGQSVSIAQLAGILQGVVGTESPVNFAARRPGDIAFSEARVGMAKEMLGFVPEVDLRQGLGSTVEWFRRIHANHPDETPHSG